MNTTFRTPKPAAAGELPSSLASLAAASSPPPNMVWARPVLTGGRDYLWALRAAEMAAGQATDRPSPLAAKPRPAGGFGPAANSQSAEDKREQRTQVALLLLCTLYLLQYLWTAPQLAWLRDRVSDFLHLAGA